jgi:hypothetical protein
VNVIGRAEALVLLAVGLGSGAFALSGDYEMLMNPTFRWITTAGAGLVTAMGLELCLRPRRGANPSALLVYGGLLVLVLVADPFAGGVTPLLLAAGDVPPPQEREGYEQLRLKDLFAKLHKEADVPPGSYVFRGLVHRTPALDAAGHVVLLEPMMACCLADLVALGVRVDLGGRPPPAAESWVYAFGTLRNLDQPLVTAPFRTGAVLFSEVSRVHIVDIDDIVSYQSLLADISQKIPDGCAIFRQALEDTGLLETLREEGPYTVFVPLDLAFERMPVEVRTALFDPAHRDRLRRHLESFVVRGRHSEGGLYKMSSLTALSGRVLWVEVVNGTLRVQGARILFPDSVARNGVLHVIHPAWPPR